MAKDFPRIGPGQSVRDAVAALIESNWPAGFILAEEGELLGVLGQREVLRGLSERTGGFFREEELAYGLVRCEAFDSETFRGVWRSFWNLPSETVMERNVPTVHIDADIASAASQFAEGAQIIAVVHDGRMSGALTARGMLSWLTENPERIRGKRNPRASTLRR